MQNASRDEKTIPLAMVRMTSAVGLDVLVELSLTGKETVDTFTFIAFRKNVGEMS